MPESPDEWPQSQAELARRYGVHRSQITRALQAAAAAHQRDPNLPAPPQPVTPPPAQARYLPAEFDPWWAARPQPGRPISIPKES